MTNRMAPTVARDVDPNDLPDGWVIDDDGIARPWWYSRTGYIVKWSIFFGLVMIVGLYLLLGYLHAKRRLRKGLVPLAYHRWLVSKRELAAVDPRYAYPQSNFTSYAPQQGYYAYGNNMGMHPMPPPPVYEPPAGATKTDPSQWRTDPTRRPGEMGYPAPEYSAPMGPPPSQQPYPYEIPQQQTGGAGGESAADKAKNLAGKALGFLKRK